MSSGNVGFPVMWNIRWAEKLSGGVLLAFPDVASTKTIQRACPVVGTNSWPKPSTKPGNPVDP
jgi:hypothetical protein